MRVAKRAAVLGLAAALALSSAAPAFASFAGDTQGGSAYQSWKSANWTAENAADSGLDGVVCSPLEAALVKEKCGENFMTVTPGIRFADSAVGDQKRIMTPEKAGKSGCDYIVVGRPITQAEDPVAAYRRAVKDFLG